MECPNCSESILDHAKVCPFCQTRLPGDHVKDIEEKYKKNKRTKKRKKRSFTIQKKQTPKQQPLKPLPQKHSDNIFEADNFDISYTISSEEQAQLIRDIVNGASAGSKVPSSTNRSKTSVRRKKKRISNKTRRLIFYSLVTILICGLLFWVCSAIFNAINGNKADTAYITYLKNNSLNVAQRGISQEISDNLINTESYRKSQIITDEESEENKASEDAVVSVEELTSDRVIEFAEEHNFVFKTENKRYIYFLSNFDVTTNLGELKCFDTKKKKIIDIAENISGGVKISKDGEHLLFLQNADFSGNAGVLCYKDINEKKSVTVSEDIDKDMYIFSENENKILFLGNFEHSLEAGELYEFDVTEKDAERVKIDTDVCRIFGTDKSGSIYIYAKAYNASRGCYDIYKKKNDEDRVLLVEETILPPVISDISDEMFMYGGNVDKTHNLYLVNVKTGDKKKIASEISDIVKITEDEKSVLYRKVFNDTSSDYYVYTKGNAEPFKVANDVRIIPEDNKFGGISQISASADLKTIAFISGFDLEKGRGVLYKVQYTGSSVRENEKIADEAFLCHCSADGKYVIYAKDYSITRDVVDVYAYTNSNNLILKEEIGYNLFEISENGDNIICISNFNQEKEYGTIELIQSNAEAVKLLDDASAFYILDDTLVMLNEYNADTKTFNVYLADKNNKTLKSGEDVTYIIL